MGQIKYLFVGLLWVSNTTLAATASDNWVKSWWENEFHQQYEQEQKKRSSKSTCLVKLEIYKKQLDIDPSEYNKWIYERWKAQCEKELQSNK